jgi:hypothetical protein
MNTCLPQLHLLTTPYVACPANVHPTSYNRSQLQIKIKVPNSNNRLGHLGDRHRCPQHLHRLHFGKVAGIHTRDYPRSSPAGALAVDSTLGPAGHCIGCRAGFGIVYTRIVLAGMWRPDFACLGMESLADRLLHHDRLVEAVEESLEAAPAAPHIYCYPTCCRGVGIRSRIGGN